MVAATFAAYFASFSLWGLLYYLAWRYDGACFIGIQSYVSAFLFAIETQQTIGFGNHAIDDCWGPAWMLAFHQVWALLLEAAFVGIVLAKISHPKGRGNAIIISESACVARRDGTAKFMFRVADIRKRTSMAPALSAQLYTWAGGRRTAEGEAVPVLVQDLPLNYTDKFMLLPVVVEHTVDERSPLYGHTRASLRASNAEVVVTYEGTSDVGGRFVVRRSYLPDEIHFGWCVYQREMGEERQERPRQRPHPLPHTHRPLSKHTNNLTTTASSPRPSTTPPQGRPATSSTSPNSTTSSLKRQSPLPPPAQPPPPLPP